MEQALIEAVLKRKQSAFTIFYNELSDKFFSFLKSTYFLSNEEINDIIADTFIKIWRNLDSFDKKKWDFISWCWLILRNTAKDYFKKKKDLWFSDIDTEEKDISFEDNLKDDEDITDLLEQNYQVDIIKSAIWKLKPEEREIIFLRYMDGFWLEEISKIMRITYSNARVKLHRSLTKLKKLLNSVSESDKDRTTK